MPKVTSSADIVMFPVDERSAALLSSTTACKFLPLRLAEALSGLAVRQRKTRHRHVESTNTSCLCHLGYPVSGFCVAAKKFSNSKHDYKIR
jgi:hypothetical protein